MNDMTIRHDPAVLMIEARRLRVAPENPRSAEAVGEDDLVDLAASIRAQGLVTPLIGYIDGQSVMVTAGGRRTRAIGLLLQDGTIAPDTLYPVRLFGRDCAIEAGEADELTHQGLTDLDCLRIIARETHRQRSSADLAAIVGRSERWIRQRRKILDLPEGCLAELWDGRITVGQAAGLTFFEDANEQLAVFERALDTPGYDVRSIHRDFVAGRMEWAEVAYSRLVGEADYIAAGGAFQMTLFSDARIVLNPAILEKLAMEAADRIVRARHPGYGVYEPGDNLWSLPVHHGIEPDLSEDEQALLEIWAEHDPDEIEEATARGELTEEDAASIKAVLAKAEPDFPDELKALLGVRYTISRWSRADVPIQVRENVLPEDRTALIAAGYLPPPPDRAAGTGTPEPATTAEPEGPAASDALRLDAKRLALHALRQELARTPDRVIALYAAHVHEPRAGIFTMTHDMEAALPDDLPVETSPAMEKLAAAARKGAAALAEARPAEARKALAHHLLGRLNLAALDRVAPAPDAATIRAFWTPDAAWFNRYRKDALAAMCLPEDAAEHVRQQKKAGLVTKCVAKAEAVKDWLPLGFDFLTAPL